VRQRRKRDDERRLVSQSLDRPTRRPAPPPVTSRNVSVDAATVRAKPRPKSDRQYQALAAAPFAPARDLQVPALPRVRIGWRLLSFLLVVLLGAGVYFAFTDPMFQVGGATLTGNQFIGAQEVNAALGMNGTPIFLIVPADAETALRLNFPEIAAVHVSVELPNTLHVAISERQPVVRWEQNGAYTWLDEEGVALRPRGDASNLVVVKASGQPPTGPKSGDDPLAPTPYVDADIVKTARMLAPYVPQGSGLMYDPKFGIGWADGRGWTVWFGASSDQVDMKLRVYIVLVDSLAQRGINPIMINVAYPDAPYYRLGN
jgi:cell division protein FtsQ